LRTLLRNAVRFLDGTVLESKSNRDHVCHDGYCVDGGLSYIRRVGVPPEGVVEYCLYSDSPFKEVREGFTWGGKLLKDLTPEYIKAILATGTELHLSDIVRELFHKELNWRSTV